MSISFLSSTLSYLKFSPICELKRQDLTFLSSSLIGLKSALQVSKVQTIVYDGFHFSWIEHSCRVHNYENNNNNNYKQTSCQKGKKLKVTTWKIVNLTKCNFMLIYYDNQIIIILWYVYIFWMLNLLPMHISYQVSKVFIFNWGGRC